MSVENFYEIHLLDEQPQIQQLSSHEHEIPISCLRPVRLVIIQFTVVVHTMSLKSFFIASLVFVVQSTLLSSAFSINLRSVAAFPRQPQNTASTTTITMKCAGSSVTLPDVVTTDDTTNDKSKFPQALSKYSNNGGAPLHPKQIVKRIQACGNNYTAALEVLYTTQPFLKPLPSQTDESATASKSAVSTEVIKYKGPFDAKPICGIINLLSKNNQFSLAIELLNDTKQQHNANIIPTYYLNAVFKSIINMVATEEQRQKQNLHREILKYIYHDIPYNTNQAPAIDIYHTALSALGKCRQTDSMLELLNDLESQRSMKILSTAKLTCLQYNFPSPDRMAYLTALTGSIRCKASHHSIEIMDRMIEQGMKPDKVVYNHVLSSLANSKSEGRYETAKKIWEEMERENICSDATYKSLIRLFSKENQWGDVAAVRDKLNCLSSTNGSGSISVDIASIPVGTHGSSPADAVTPRYIKDLEKLQKVDNVKKTWYKLGIVRISEELEIEFGIQTHRTPILNGISLVFYTPSGEKLGFMLIRNQLEHLPHKIEKRIFFSSILGMFVDEKHRGQGLANMFMGTWLQICVNSRALPRSEKINKPLLSLVLSNFGFIPVSDSAIEIEIAPIAEVYDVNTNDLSWKPLFSLYSLSPLNFGERELRIQKMIVSRCPPSPRGKVTAVRTIFEHPMTQKAQRGENYEQEANELSGLIEGIWRFREKKLNSPLTLEHGKTQQVEDKSKHNCNALDENQNHSPNDENGNQTGIKFFIDDKLLQRVIFGYLF